MTDRDELLEKAKETKQELEAEQTAILESIQEEHGGDIIETEVTITEDHEATVKTKINGKLMNRMTHVENQLTKYEEDKPFTGIERTMDEAASILADAIVEEEFDKRLFYGVYEEEGPDALGILIQRVFTAIGEESDRKNGRSGQ